MARGEQQLAQGQSFYKNVKQTSLAAAVVSPVTGIFMLTGDHMARKKIDAGKSQITEGRQKIQSGEERLAAGKLALQKGLIQLQSARAMRMLCAVSAIFFIFLFVVVAIQSFRKSKQ